MAYAEPKMLDEDEVPKANADLVATKDRSDRGQAAVAMKVAGAPYSDIARVLEYPSPSHARQAVERALATTVDGDDREHMRFIEGRRLERLLRGLWKKATDEKSPEHLAAVRTALAVIDRHARLYGLDAPTEHVIYSPSAVELQEWVALASSHVRTEMPDEADILEGEVVGDEEDDE